MAGATGRAGSNRPEPMPDSWPGQTIPQAVRVFLTAAPSDQRLADTVANDLRMSGVAIERNPTSATDSTLPRLVQSGLPPDWLVVIVSPDALWSPLIADEMRLANGLLRNRRMRGVLAIVATASRHADIPPDWPISRVFDASRDFPAAMSQLRATLGVTQNAPQSASKRPFDVADEETARVPAHQAADEATMRLRAAPGALAPTQQSLQQPARRPTTRPAQERTFARLVPPSGQPAPQPVSSAAHPASPSAHAALHAAQGPLISRRALLGAGAVAVASVLAGGGVYAWRRSQKAPPRPGPTVRWRIPIQGRITTAAVEAGGFVYVGADNGHFYAIDASSHTIRWMYQAHWPIDQSTPVVAANAVYFCASDGSVNKLSTDPTISSDAARLRWRFRVKDKPFPTPALGDGLLYATAGFNGLYALDSQTGALRWRTRPTFNPTSPPTLAGNRIYVAAANAAFALDSNGGAPLWQTPVAGAVYARMPVVNGVLYVSSLGKAVYALDATSGKQRWRFPMDAQVYTMPVVDTTLGAVYIGGSDNSLYALDSATGALRWRQRLESPLTTPRLVHGRLYVTSAGGYLYAFNPANGALLWDYAAGQGAVSPLGAGMNTLYVGTFDGYLYALAVP